MGNGMSFKAGRDMPPGMQEKMAMKMVAELQQKNGVPSDGDIQRAQTRQTVTMTANNERMVSANKLVTMLAKRFRNKGMIHYDDLMAVIADVPTVDAGIVIRCKECKHWRHMEDGFGDCTNGRFHLDGHADPTMNADDFCSCGERENDGNQTDSV